MSNLPKGWRVVQLKDIFERVTRKNEENNSNALTISAQQGLINQKEYFNKVVASKDLSNYYLLHNGEFAYNKSYSTGYPMGVIKRLDKYDKGALSTLYICFRISSDLVDTDYVLEYFSAGNFDKEISSIAQEGARNHGLLNVGVSDFFNLRIVLPPLEEQKKIADILSTVDKKIAFVEENINATEELKKGLMQKLLTEGIGHTEFKDSELGRIPESWEIKSIEDIAEVKGGKRLPKGSSLSEEKTPYPYIRVTNMFMGGIDLSEIQYVPVDIQPQIKNYTISKNDLFISVAGTLGIVGEVPKELDNANLTENADKLTNIKIDRKYLLYIFMSNLIQNEISKHTTSNAQPKLALTKIKTFKIPVAPLEEQKQIVEILSTVDNKLENLKYKKQSFEELKKGLMQKLLTGEVRV